MAYELAGQLPLLETLSGPVHPGAADVTLSATGPSGSGSMRTPEGSMFSVGEDRY